MNCRVLPTLLLIVLILSSGCNAPSKPDIPESQNSSVTGANPTDFPSGIAENGTVDPRAVVQGHQRAIENSSYTVHLTHREYYTNGSLRILVTESTFRGSEGRNYYFDYRADEPAVSLGNENGTWYREWARQGNSVYAVRLNATDSTRYGPGPSNVILSQYSDLDNVYVLLSHLNTSVTVVDENNEPRYVIRAKAANASTDLGTLADQLSPAEVESVTGVEFILVLESTGVIEQYSMEYTIESNEGTIHLLEMTHYTDVNSTEIPRPGWVSKAINRTR